MPLPDDINQRVFLAIKQEFAERVIPLHILPYLKCLSRIDEEEIIQVQRNKGDTNAAYELICKLARKDPWLKDVTRALRNDNVGLPDLADKIDHEKSLLPVTINIESVTDQYGINCFANHCHNGYRAELQSMSLLYASGATPHQYTTQPGSGHACICGQPAFSKDGIGERQEEDMEFPCDETLMKPVIPGDDYQSGMSSDGQNAMAISQSTPLLRTKPAFAPDTSATATVPPGSSSYGAPGQSSSSMSSSEGCFPAEATTQVYRPVPDDLEERRKRVKLDAVDHIIKSFKDPKDFPKALVFIDQIHCRIDRCFHRSINVMVWVPSLERLDSMWKIYKGGGLGKVFEQDILKPELVQAIKQSSAKEGLEVQSINLSTEIRESHYQQCKVWLTSTEEKLSPNDPIEGLLMFGKDIESRDMEIIRKCISVYRDIVPRILLQMIHDPLLTSGFFKHIGRTYAELKRDIKEAAANPSASVEATGQDVNQNASYVDKTVYRHVQWVFKTLQEQLDRPKDEEGTSVPIKKEDILLIAAVALSDICSTSQDIVFLHQNTDGKVSLRVSDYVKEFYSPENSDLSGIQLPFPKEALATGTLTSSLESMEKIVLSKIPQTDGSYQFKSTLFRDYLFAHILNIKGVDLVMKVTPHLRKFKYLHILSSFDNFRPDPKRVSRFDVLQLRSQSEQMLYETLLVTTTCGRARSDWRSYRQDLAEKVKILFPDDVFRSTQPLLSVESKRFLKDCLKMRFIRSDHNFEICDASVLPSSQETVRGFIESFCSGRSELEKQLLKIGGTRLSPTIDNREFAMICKVIQTLDLLEGDAKGTGVQSQTKNLPGNANDEPRPKMAKSVASGPEEDCLCISVQLPSVKSTRKTVLDVSKLDLNRSKQRQLSQCLETLSTVNHIALRQNKLNVPCVQELLTAAPFTNLTHLNLSDNETLDLLDGPLHLWFAPNLESLDLHNIGLKDNGSSNIALDLRELTKLRKLDISQNKLSHSGISQVCNALSNKLCLTRINVGENPLGPKGGCVLASLLHALPFLEALNITSCNVGDIGLTVIAETLQGRKMKSLKTKGNNGSKTSSEEVFENLSSQTDLVEFDYSGNVVSSAKMDYSDFKEHQKLPLDTGSTIRFFHGASLLERVSMDKCGLKDISDILFSSENSDIFSAVTHLSLRSNSLGDLSVQIISKFLQTRCKFIEHLDLGDNGITAEGILPFIDAVKEKGYLKVLQLDQNQLKLAGAQAVLTGTMFLEGLIKVDLMDNGMEVVDKLNLAAEVGCELIDDSYILISGQDIMRHVYV